MLTFCAIALGGNATSSAGTPEQTLVSALLCLSGLEIGLSGVSRFWRTPAFPAGSGPDFVNAAATLMTKRSAKEVLTVLHDVEDRFGRVRSERWGQRTLDLDLLFHGADVLPDRATQKHWMTLPSDRQRQESPEHLVLPHPRLQDRSFVLIPLSEVAPTWCHPQTGLSVAEMAAAVPEAEKRAMRPL